jgi:hypothetical protein
MLRPTTDRLATAFADAVAPLVRRQTEAFVEALAPVLERNTELAARFLAENAEQLRRVQALGEALQLKWLPPNWRELSIAGFQRTRLVAETGAVSIVWVPRHDIVGELVGAETYDECSRVLLERRAEVLDDLEASLAECTMFGTPAHADFVVTARDAVRARAGADRAAHAAAAAAITHLIQEVLGRRVLKTAREEFERTPLSESGIMTYRRALLQSVSAASLSFTGDNVPGFNRHGVAHVGGTYWDEADMLRGLLLVVGWARELAWIMEHEPETVRRRPDPPD